jgi:uncharacterized protein (TIGR03086 family)
MIDLTPATGMLAQVVTDINDDQLAAPTPCDGATVADLLDHVDGLSLAFAETAGKRGGEQGPSADGTQLTADWRTRIPERLARLAGAWQDEAAWSGMTKAGGQELPAEVAAAVAINEVLVHGWDLAVATGQAYSGDDALVQAAFSFVQPTVEQNPGGSPGLFGPPVAVAQDAATLDRLIAATGRDPGWRPAGAS